MRVPTSASWKVQAASKILGSLNAFSVIILLTGLLTSFAFVLPPSIPQPFRRTFALPAASPSEPPPPEFGMADIPGINGYTLGKHPHFAKGRGFLINPKTDLEKPEDLLKRPAVPKGINGVNAGNNGNLPGRDQQYTNRNRQPAQPQQQQQQQPSQQYEQQFQQYQQYNPQQQSPPPQQQQPPPPPPESQNWMGKPWPTPPPPYDTIPSTASQHPPQPYQQQQYQQPPQQPPPPPQQQQAQPYQGQPDADQLYQGQQQYAQPAYPGQPFPDQQYDYNAQQDQQPQQQQQVTATPSAPPHDDVTSLLFGPSEIGFFTKCFEILGWDDTKSRSFLRIYLEARESLAYLKSSVDGEGALPAEAEVPKIPRAGKNIKSDLYFILEYTIRDLVKDKDWGNMFFFFQYEVVNTGACIMNLPSPRTDKNSCLSDIRHLFINHDVKSLTIQYYSKAWAVSPEDIKVGAADLGSWKKRFEDNFPDDDQATYRAIENHLAKTVKKTVNSIDEDAQEYDTNLVEPYNQRPPMEALMDAPCNSSALVVAGEKGSGRGNALYAATSFEPDLTRLFVTMPEIEKSAMVMTGEEKERLQIVEDMLACIQDNKLDSGDMKDVMETLYRVKTGCYRNRNQWTKKELYSQIGKALDGSCTEWFEKNDITMPGSVLIVVDDVGRKRDCTLALVDIHRDLKYDLLYRRKIAKNCGFVFCGVTADDIANKTDIECLGMYRTQTILMRTEKIKTENIEYSELIAQKDYSEAVTENIRMLSQGIHKVVQSEILKLFSTPFTNDRLPETSSSEKQGVDYATMLNTMFRDDVIVDYVFSRFNSLDKMNALPKNQDHGVSDKSFQDLLKESVPSMNTDRDTNIRVQGGINRPPMPVANGQYVHASGNTNQVNEAHRSVVHSNGAYQNGAELNGAHSNGYQNGAHSNGAYGNGGYGNGPYSDSAHQNGPYQNGAEQNGAYQNGSHQYGAYQNGAHSNGAPQNGAYQNSSRQNGAGQPDPGYVNGAPQNGAPPNGAYQTGNQQSGSYQQGAQQAGGYQNGATQNGARQNDAHSNGAYQNGAQQAQAFQSGAQSNGATQNGAHSNAAYQNGAAPNGMQQPGSAQPRPHANGAQQNGAAQNAAHQAGTYSNGAQQNGVHRNPAQSNEFPQNGAHQTGAYSNGAAYNGNQQNGSHQNGASQHVPHQTSAQQHGARQNSAQQGSVPVNRAQQNAAQQNAAQQNAAQQNAAQQNAAQQNNVRQNSAPTDAVHFSGAQQNRAQQTGAPQNAARRGDDRSHRPQRIETQQNVVPQNHSTQNGPGQSTRQQNTQLPTSHRNEAQHQKARTNEAQQNQVQQNQAQQNQVQQNQVRPNQVQQQQAKRTRAQRNEMRRTAVQQNFAQQAPKPDKPAANVKPPAPQQAVPTEPVAVPKARRQEGSLVFKDVVACHIHRLLKTADTGTEVDQYILNAPWAPVLTDPLASQYIPSFNTAAHRHDLASIAKAVMGANGAPANSIIIRQGSPSAQGADMFILIKDPTRASYRLDIIQAKNYHDISDKDVNEMISKLGAVTSRGTKTGFEPDDTDARFDASVYRTQDPKQDAMETSHLLSDLVSWGTNSRNRMRDIKNAHIARLAATYLREHLSHLINQPIVTGDRILVVNCKSIDKGHKIKSVNGIVVWTNEFLEPTLSEFNVGDQEEESSVALNDVEGDICDAAAYYQQGIRH